MKNKEQLLSLIESEIKAKLSQGERLGLAELLKEVLNLIMIQERELFLSKKDSFENKALLSKSPGDIFGNLRFRCAKG